MSAPVPAVMPVTTTYGAHSSGAKPRPKALLADPAESTRRELEAMLSARGYDIAIATSRSNIMEQFIDFTPDLVLLDMSLAGADTYTVLEWMREAVSPAWTPVLLLAPSADAESVVLALNAGACEVLQKPVNLSVLSARVDSLRRITDTQSSLQRYRVNVETEAELARAIMERIIHSDELGDPALDWRVIPATTFSGDQIAAARSPRGHLYVLLADAAGHGLAAAITLLPLLLVFYSMVAKDFRTSDMVAEMNSKLKEILVPGQYAAIALVRYDSARKEAEYWNGGLPPGLLLDKRGHVLLELPSSYLPLGIQDEAQFDPSCEIIDTDGTGALILYSDGLIEAQNESGAALGRDPLRHWLQGPPRNIIQRVFGGLHLHLRGHPVQDDVSFAAIRLEP
jgi:two-component system, HptB-dependent secretion and biofilm response regulator